MNFTVGSSPAIPTIADIVISNLNFLKGKDKKKLKKKDLYVIGKNIGKMHKALRKIKLYRKNS